ncbi:YgaP family membrane protein [Metapseudomonas otitidis]|uniref:YgaP family membrane protein n=1 Tax=Metapseudomonas otitidis TaxID=319939 RepID=UPI0008E7F332|nr:DUF2892 domain-containing protein [Pseudomonas otitidis]SFA63167.1 Protein of unknown function [Pseudomonas otitidis]
MNHEYQNVHGIERALSLGTGLVALCTGIHRGGTAGTLKALTGALLLWRGTTGHCAMKGMVTNLEGELEYLRQRIARLREALPKVDNAQGKARTPTEAKVDNAIEETFPASDPISP